MVFFFLLRLTVIGFRKLNLLLNSAKVLYFFSLVFILSIKYYTPHPRSLVPFSVYHNLQSHDTFKIHLQNFWYSSFQEEELISLPLEYLLAYFY